MTLDETARGRHHRSSAADRRAVAAIPPTPRSSPPTAASTTPAPPGSTRPCSSATSTRSRRLGLAWASEHTEVVRHPVDKAATDTELADRPRRLLSTPTASCSWPARATASTTPSPPSARSAPGAGRVGSLEAWWGNDQLHVVHGPARRPRPAAGTTFSVLAMHGPCAGVTVDGARWPLDDHDLAPLVGLGVSNQVATPRSRWRSTTASSPSSSPEPPREAPPSSSWPLARRRRRPPPR